MRAVLLTGITLAIFPALFSCANAQRENKTTARKRIAGVDWPRFLGPNGDGTSPEKGIRSPWPKKEGLPLVWRKKVGIGYAGPSIADGRLYFFDRHGDKARLTCMDAETGKERWRFEYPTDYVDKYGYNGGPRCCPVIDGDRVYIFGVEGMLHCLSTEGKLLWKIDTMKKFNVVQNFFGVASVPLVEGDLLIVQIGGSPPGSDDSDFLSLKGNGSGIVAFNKHNGKIVYKVTDELASYSSPVAVTIGNRRWGFLFARGGLVGFEPKTGKVDFHFPYRAKILESVNAANPVVVGNKVLISETYGPGAALVEVRPGGYKVLWTDEKKPPRKKALQAHWATPIHHAGYVYGCSGRHDYNAELRCIELATGKVMWSKPGLARTQLLKVDGHFVGLSEYGFLFLFKINPKRFEPISVMNVRPKDLRETQVDDPYWFAPVLSHGLLYVRGDNYLTCYELIPPKKGGKP